MPARAILPEEEIIFQYHVNKISAAVLGNLHNVMPQTIRRMLARNNIPLHSPQRKHNKLSEQEENQVVKLYSKNDKLSCNDLADKYDISHSAIVRILKENNVEIRKVEIIHPDINFIRGHSNEKYYFFGFCLGDGSIYPKGKIHELCIALNKKDKIILEQFCEYLMYPKERIRHKQVVVNGKTHNHVVLQIANNIWSNDYSDLGLVHNKTDNPSTLNIPKKWVKPYLIGYTDADGTVDFLKYKNRACRYSLVGHKQNMEWAADNLISLGVKTNIRIVDVKKKVEFLPHGKDLL